MRLGRRANRVAGEAAHGQSLQNRRGVGEHALSSLSHSTAGALLSGSVKSGGPDIPWLTLAQPSGILWLLATKSVSETQGHWVSH